MDTPQRLDRFRSLLLREWMQHRIGWLVLASLPTLLALVLALMDGRGITVHLDKDEMQVQSWSALPLQMQLMGWSVATLGIGLLLVGLSVLGQLPGLARRDEQDRSLEFWRSLPTSHVQSLGATVLMHLLLMPALALTAALVGAQLVALLTMLLHHGPQAWLQLPWGSLLAGLPLALLRLWLGLLMAVLWLSPVLLLTMAAAVWLQRWAVPVIVTASVAGIYWLDARLPVPLVGPTYQRLGNEALYALVAPDLFTGPHRLASDNLDNALVGLPLALLHDAGRVLASAATPAFLAAVAAGALGFGLLVLRRQRAV